MQNTDALQFQVPLRAQPQRLDKYLATLLTAHSRARIQQWIEEGHVLVNHQPATRKQQLLPGDRIQVWPQARPEDQSYQAEDLALDRVAHNPAWVVLNKAAGWVTHPGAGNWSGTVLNALLFHYPTLKQVARAGIVHRLDKDTSGLMVVALTESTQLHLSQQLQERSVEREYWALCHGHVAPEGCIQSAIGRDRHVPIRMSTDRPIAAKEARTHFKTLAHGLHPEHGRFSLVQCNLETGRTHQIRVHLSSIGHALVGDSLYGGRHVLGAQRQMLHARALGFIDPISAQPQRFEQAPPVDFDQVYQQIQWQALN